MRVVLVSDQYPPMVGGVPTVTRTLAIHLAQRGHQVWVIAPSPGRQHERSLDEGVLIHRFASFDWPLYPGQRIALVALRAMRRLLGEADPQVVHLHSPLTLGWVAQCAARMLRKLVIATHHYLPANVNWSLQANTQFSAAVHAYFTWFYNRCALVTAPSRSAVRMLQAHGLLVPARVVSNGVDLQTHRADPPDCTIRRRLNLPEDRPLVLHVNRLAPEKRIDVLLRAATQLRADVHIALVGAGPAEAELRALAARLRLSDRVSFLGFIGEADLLALRYAADVCAIASEAELQSLSTMEAMACGLPVVAADAGALPELVHHGENGFLFAPGDSAMLARYLDCLLSDARLRARAGALSLKRIAQHDRACVLDRWEALYSCLAAAPQREATPRPVMLRTPAAPVASAQGA